MDTFSVENDKVSRFYCPKVDFYALSCHQLICIYILHRTLSALAHDLLPSLKPGTRSRISARFMAPGDETSRAHQGGAPRAGAAVCGLLAMCAPSSCASKVFRKPRAFPLWKLGPPITEGVWVVASVARPGPGKLLLAVTCFRFGRTRVCIAPISRHRGKTIGYFKSFGKNCSKQWCKRWYHTV